MVYGAIQVDDRKSAAEGDMFVDVGWVLVKMKFICERSESRERLDFKEKEKRDGLLCSTVELCRKKERAVEREKEKGVLVIGKKKKIKNRIGKRMVLGFGNKKIRMFVILSIVCILGISLSRSELLFTVKKNVSTDIHEYCELIGKLVRRRGVFVPNVLEVPCKCSWQEEAIWLSNEAERDALLLVFSQLETEQKNENLFCKIRNGIEEKRKSIGKGNRVCVGMHYRANDNFELWEEVKKRLNEELLKLPHQPQPVAMLELEMEVATVAPPGVQQRSRPQLSRPKLSLDLEGMEQRQQEVLQKLNERKGHPSQQDKYWFAQSEIFKQDFKEKEELLEKAKQLEKEQCQGIKPSSHSNGEYEEWKLEQIKQRWVKEGKRFRIPRGEEIKPRYYLADIERIKKKAQKTEEDKRLIELCENYAQTPEKRADQKQDLCKRL
ncbi:MAG: hypothetical protein LBU29_00195, partial [Endomicrobium sp.]|nr:hypothetical protein [Endomicrobium sp.]